MAKIMIKQIAQSGMSPPITSIPFSTPTCLDCNNCSQTLPHVAGCALVKHHLLITAKTTNQSYFSLVQLTNESHSWDPSGRVRRSGIPARGAKLCTLRRCAHQDQSTDRAAIPQVGWRITRRRQQWRPHSAARAELDVRADDAGRAGKTERRGAAAVIKQGNGPRQ